MSGTGSGVFHSGSLSGSLDPGETALRRWVQQLELERGGGTPVSKALTAEHARIQELEARVYRRELSCNIQNYLLR